MTARGISDHAEAKLIPNGPGAAAVLAAGIGAFLVAIFALIADKSAAVKSAMIFYRPTGTLSGVTTCAIAVWLLAWLVLHRRWKKRNVAMGRISTIAFVLLGLGFLLTLPPLADLF